MFYEWVCHKMFWTLLGYTSGKNTSSPRNSTWFTRPFSSYEKLRLTSTHNRHPIYWPLTSCCSVQRNLEGHVGDVYTCRFFPSGIVVLSGGADMRLKIWSAEDGSCPRTLIGHTRGWLNSSIDVWLVNYLSLGSQVYFMRAHFHEWQYAFV